MKFWEIKNLSESKGELYLYGDISETSWWGDEVTPKQFADDLKNLGSVSDIDVRINSMGGDVFAANTIASLLRAHSANVNVYVDGVAASAATIIAMAGDKVYMPENAMMMIHDPLVSLWGYYNTEDFKEFIAVLEKIKDSIATGYIAKTKKSKEEIDEIMSNETWLLGAEAVEQGFADELISFNLDVDVENTGGHKFMIVNKCKFDVSNYKNMPKIHSEAMKRPEKTVQIHNKKPQREENDMDLKEFQNNYPDLYNQVKNAGYEEGVSAERDRIKNIENMAPKGYENMVKEAKFENTTTAEELAMKILNSQKQSGKNYMNKAEEDADDLDGVEPSEEKEKSDKDKEEAKNLLSGAFKNRRNR